MAGYGNAIMVYQMLLRNGVQPNAAAGAITSLMGESGKFLDPTASNPNDPGGSIGMGQWNRERLSNLHAYAQARGTSIYDPSTQVGFIEHELQGSHSGVLAKLRGTNDYGTAANIWTADYEAPAVNNTAGRIASNRAVVQQALSGTGVDTSTYAGNLTGKDRFALGPGPTSAEAPVPPELQGSDPTSELASGLASATTLAPAESTGLKNDAPWAGDAVATATKAASASSPIAAGVAPDELSARYDQAKLRGGVLGEGQLADLFKVKDIGQAKQIKPTRRIA